MDWFESANKRRLEWKQQEHRFKEAVPVLELAGQEARRLNQNFTGTEHLLLGLLAYGKGVAFEVLRQHGLELENTRVEVGRCCGRGSFKEPFPQVPYTPRAKKTVEQAWQEARGLKRDSILPEHLLLALLRDHEGPAARVFQEFKVDFEATRNEVLAKLCEHDGAADA